MINGTMMQFFHWYTPDGGSLWNELQGIRVHTDLVLSHKGGVDYDDRIKGTAIFSNCIGWTREGIDEHVHSGYAVLLSNSGEGFKYPGENSIDDNGWGEFHVRAVSVSVWVEKEGCA